MEDNEAMTAGGTMANRSVDGLAEETNVSHVAILVPSRLVREFIVRALDPTKFRLHMLSVTDAGVLAELEALRPSFIFINAVLGVMSGVELCNLVKGSPALKRTRIVFLSSSEEKTEQAIQNRADHFLRIPFTVDDVAGIVDAQSRKTNTILFVDDSRTIHACVVPALQAEGFRVIQAWNGEEAMALMAREAPDMIVTDIEMPEMNGYELCRAAKTRPNLNNIPILFVSSLDNDESIEQGFAAGADDYLTKPIVLPELVSRVRRLLKPATTLRQERVLAVSGCPRSRGLMAGALRLNGLEVDESASMTEALNLAGSRSYNLFVADTEGAEAEANQFCYSLRSHESTAAIPVILVCPRKSKADIVRFSSAGVQAFLAKPFQPDRLIAEAERLLAELRLLRQKEMMHNYLSEGAVSAIERRLGSENICASRDKYRTILFTDIVNFTTLCENRTAREVVALLNLYFDRMVAVLLQYDALIDKFIGDAIMAVFGRQADGAHRAIGAGLAMLQALPGLRQETGVDLHMRVGINSGHVIVGDIGSMRSRRDFTVIGDNVNIAQRLESMADVDGILISESTYQMVRNLVRVEPAGELTLKGKNRSQTAWRVLAIEPYRLKS